MPTPANTDSEARLASYPVVAVGVDTLHYTAPIEIGKDLALRLETLKVAAQRNQGELLFLGGEGRHGAAIASGAIAFEMSPSATKRYRWRLYSEEWSMALLLTDAATAPGVKVELGSRVLWHFGQEEAYQLSRRLVAELCGCGPAFEARPARIDFTVDFQGVGFHRDMQIAMVSRARRPPDFQDLKGLCVACDAPFLDDRAVICSVCKAPRRKDLVLERELPAHLVHQDAGELVTTYGRRLRRFGVVVSGERCPNPHLLPRGAMLEHGALPMQRYGGNPRRQFTGWSFGGGDPLLVRIYDKTFEIKSNSPDKVWFYSVWNRSEGYLHSYCRGCGREHDKAVVVPADAPLLPDEILPPRPRLTKQQQRVRQALGLEDTEPPVSMLPRVVRRLCPHCDEKHYHQVVPVWRLELQVRGNLLAKITPDGNPLNRIRTVDDVLKNANEIWSILVGQPNRHCKKCHFVPEGTSQRWRVCRRCLDAKQNELGRELDAEDADDRALMAEFKMVRRPGWIEARDASRNPDGKTANMPVTDWWRRLQSMHFTFSQPATMTSGRLKDIASAAINRMQVRGSLTSWASTTRFGDKITRELGRAPTAKEYVEGLLREFFAEEDPLELYATIAHKDVRNGLPYIPLSPSSAKPPGRVDVAYCRGCGEVNVPVDSNGFCKSCEMPPPPAKRRNASDRSEVN